MSWKKDEFENNDLFTHIQRTHTHSLSLESQNSGIEGGAAGGMLSTGNNNIRSLLEPLCLQIVRSSLRIYSARTSCEMFN